MDWVLPPGEDANLLAVMKDRLGDHWAGCDDMSVGEDEATA